MLGYLILLFTIVPIIELALLIKLGQYIGVGYTLTLVILTGIVGAYLTKTQGIKVLWEIQEDINTGIMPTERIVEGMMILGGGILLLTPGLITDLIGFIVLFPLTRGWVKIWIKHIIRKIIEVRIITVNEPRY